MVVRRDRIEPLPLGDRHQAGVGRIEPQVGVLAAQGRNALPILMGEIHQLQRSTDDQVEKAGLGLGAEPVEDQPRRLRNDWNGRRQLVAMLGEHSNGVVVPIRRRVSRRETFVSTSSTGRYTISDERCARS